MSTKKRHSISRRKARVLVVIRHAHRNKNRGRHVDNGLSTRGRAQARRLLSFYKRGHGKGWSPRVYSSPKKRCWETVDPLAHYYKQQIERDQDLDEGGLLQKKVRAFYRRWLKSQDSVTLICSHGDWIPCFALEILGITVDLKKGGMIEVERGRGKLRVNWIVQKF